MENTDITQLLDSDRWLLNNGLVSDNVKNQLFFCGSIVHKDVQAVELKITPETKLVDYIIYVTPDLIKKIALYNKLSVSKSLFGMWRFKRLLKKEGCLDLQKVLNSFVTDYCGPKWTAKASIISFDCYVDSLEVDNEDSRAAGSDKSLDNG
jgi:hypothetical protein